MKKLALIALGFTLLTGSAMARPHGGVFVGFGGGYGGGYGGCGPRYYAPPVCYTPRAYYCPPPVAYCAPVYAPRVVYAPVYRAPIVTTSVSVSPFVFGWRR